MPKKTYDAIVLGARCAGSPTAMLLARNGHRVLVVDRATFPSDTISTHLVQPPGVAALWRWGLLDRVVATGCPPIDSYAFDLGPFTIVGAPGTMRLTWQIDTDAQAGLEAEIFGKRILATDHDDWSLAQVIDAYRCQEELEAGFRQAKDTHVVSFAPIRHFIDHKIRVHLFTCMLALAPAHLMRREATRADLAMSVPALLAELEGIEETILLYQGERGRPRARHTITKMTPTQQRLYEVFDLDKYAPRR